ncbi:hypothetical protein [Flavobacterium hungaricum]|uniref:Uncharacterized protein n=1 Tax=Flavobacterium hungaricum TaxID=2082725 RepID=A0ABR9TKA0_9FLAO|nr:hypothetical protein [Flavobacterium hungaricum]MBE8725793.1 hypothetical protein [Flavobacterium hungaricum]
MKTFTKILFFIGVFLFLSSYIIDPYKVNEGSFIVIDADTVAFLKMLYITTSLLFGYSFYAFLKILKVKTYMIFSLILLVINLVFLCKMFFYFDSFLE